MMYGFGNYGPVMGMGINMLFMVLIWLLVIMAIIWLVKAIFHTKGSGMLASFTCMW